MTYYCLGIFRVETDIKEVCPVLEHLAQFLGEMNPMGRITPSFRQHYKEAIRELKNGFRKTLIDVDLREAFDLLLREAWGPE